MLFAKYIKNQADIAIFLIRVMIGIIFVINGYQKIKLVLNNSISESIFINPYFVQFLSLFEIIGGIFLILGLFSRFLSILLLLLTIAIILTPKLQTLKLNLSLTNSVNNSTLFLTDKSSNNKLLETTDLFSSIFKEGEKFKPITDWIIYRRFENQILQAVRQKIKEQYGVDLSASLEDKLRARLFAKSLEHGIFRFTDQDTLRYIRFVENPKALIPYFATLEIHAPTTKGTILTPTVKQALGLTEPPQCINLNDLELSLVLLFCLLAIILQGPGKYSIDLGVIKKELI